MRNYLFARPVLKSFSGEEKDLCVHEWVPCGQSGSAGHNGPDMVGMAQWALHYLLHNPQKSKGYECRFGISPLSIPPAPLEEWHDPIAVGDTESRMELEFVYMRDMTGSTAGHHIEDAIRTRLVSYVRNDGLCWCGTGSGCTGDFDIAAMPWTTGHLLRSTAERYQRTHDERDHKLCRRLVEGLKTLANRRGDLMWYEGGLAPWRDGKWLNICQDFYPSIVNPLVRYWEVCGEADVLEFAEAMSEGIVAGVQTALAGQRIAPDGSHSSGNCHLIMRAVLGVAQVGIATGNARYIEWARRVYEYTRANGTDWGWYPEQIWDPKFRYWSETCITGDMVECAAAFASGGYPEYWDHVERAVRNYLAEAQFFLTPEFVTLYQKTHADKPEQVEKGLLLLRNFEGGFLARQRPNDWVYRRDGQWQVNMMGCCPPEGMRALYIAWANTVLEQNGKVYINMALDRDAPAARVTAYTPKEGRIVVETRKAADYYVRPPSWTPQAQVQTLVNDRPVTPDWHQAYLRFRNVKAGNRLEISYPLPLFTQRVLIGCERSEELYHVTWAGNDVTEVSPRGEHLPIFAKTRQPIPPLPEARIE